MDTIAVVRLLTLRKFATRMISITVVDQDVYPYVPLLQESARHSLEGTTHRLDKITIRGFLNQILVWTSFMEFVSLKASTASVCRHIVLV